MREHTTHMKTVAILRVVETATDLQVDARAGATKLLAEAADRWTFSEKDELEMGGRELYVQSEVAIVAESVAAGLSLDAIVEAFSS